ncbi:MAG: hypothetical protein RR744_00195 [Cellulosilyticaceae bacterium]
MFKSIFDDVGISRLTLEENIREWAEVLYPEMKEVSDETLKRLAKTIDIFLMEEECDSVGCHMCPFSSRRYSLSYIKGVKGDSCTRIKGFTLSDMQYGNNKDEIVEYLNFVKDVLLGNSSISKNAIGFQF